MLTAPKRLLATAAALSAAAFLSACADPRPLNVVNAWVRLSPNPDSPSAGYFTVRGGPQPVELLAVTTDAALRLEMHESKMAGGRMTMAPLKTVAIPAQQDVAFAPGGRHLMLWGLNSGAVKAGKITLTFIFSNGDRILADAAIRKAGEDAPKAAGGNTMQGMDGHEGH
jgi:periplasmic copper chaperone A